MNSKKPRRDAIFLARELEKKLLRSWRVYREFLLHVFLFCFFLFRLFPKAISSHGTALPWWPHRHLKSQQKISLTCQKNWEKWDHCVPKTAGWILFSFFNSQLGVFVSFYFNLFFWPYYSACGILVSWPEIKPVPPALGTCILTTGPPGIVLLNHSSGSDMEDRL